MRGIISWVAKQLRLVAGSNFAPQCTPSFGSHTKPWPSLRGRSRTVAEICRAIDLQVCNMSNMSSEKRDAYSHLLSGS